MDGTIPPTPEDTLTLIAGGDIGPVVQPVERLAELALPVLEEADFRFGQCERTYARADSFPRWHTVPISPHSRLEPEYAEIFRASGMDVVSMASNHALDWGYPPFLATLTLFEEMGIRTVGGGRTEDDARRPAILSKNGVSIAILAYCSVLRDGWSASGDVPGLAAIRAATSYEPIDFQPGTPPRPHTVANARDLEAAVTDIAAIKEQVDAVVVSIHWGIPYLPKVLAEYQQSVAHALIDAGADVILGHHAHSLRAVEEYAGGLCFYSIGNFMTTGNLTKKPSARWGLYWYDQPPPGSLYNFPDHCRKAVLPRLTFTRQGLIGAALVPVLMNGLAQPEPLRADDPRYDDVLDYLEWVSDEHAHSFTRADREIVVR